MRHSPSHIAFVRAITVRGHTSLKMADLTRAFVTAGCTNVRSYIQRGNIIFRPPATSAKALDQLRRQLEVQLGHELVVMFRTVRHIERIVDAKIPDPFRSRPRVKRYVAFLAGRPRHTPRFPIRSTTERLDVVAMKGLDVFIVSRPKPTGSYGMPNIFIEELLGVPATCRSWSTLTRLVESARDESAM